MRQNISDFLTTYCWTKIRHFLISLIIILFAGVTPALGAGYSCPTYMKYTSCNTGYYISDCGTTYDGRTIAESALTTGNSCKLCPNGYDCSSGGRVCPKPSTISVTCSGGKYIAAGATTCSSTCPSKSICAGGTFTIPASGATQNTGITGTCPSDYPNSDTGISSDAYCYKTATKYGSQNDPTMPTGCAARTLSACTPGSCTYRDYKSATDGTCTPTNCTKGQTCTSASANYYLDSGTAKTCSSYSSTYTKSDGGNIGSGSCYITRTNTGTETAPTLPTGCAAQTVNSCTKPTCTYKDYAGQTGETCSPGTCQQTHKACTSAKANYYLSSGVAKTCSSSNASYPSSDGGNITSSSCYGSFSKSGTQLNGTTPTNCHAVTEWNSCTPGTCNYTKYASGTIKTDCTPSNCTKTVKAVSANDGYYDAGTTCSACPSGYPNSADANEGGITKCYSNTKKRAWTGSQVNGSTPANCHAVTEWNACSIAACDYVAYSNSAGTGDGTVKSGCSTNSANCTKTVKAVSANDGYYDAGTTCSACPSGYPNSADANEGGITKCYSNTKSRAWTGSQTTCSKPTNAYDHTCNTCSNAACTYVAYSNSAGTGDGTIKSGCSTNNAACQQTLNTFRCINGFYQDGTACTQCPSDFPLTDPQNAEYSNETAKSMCWRNCNASDVPNSYARTGWKEYDGNNTCAATSCQAGYYLENGTCKSCDSGYTSGNAMTQGRGYCYKTCASKTGYTLTSGLDYYSANDTCSYSANCNAITINPFCGVGSNSTVYKKTDTTGWYSDSACTTSITKITMPTCLDWIGRGIYSTNVPDLYADGNPGTQYFTKSGNTTTAGTNWTVNAPATIYAGWAHPCTEPSNGSCSVSVSDTGNVDYTTSCNTGYTISGNNGYNPSCSANCNAIGVHAYCGSEGVYQYIYKKTDTTGWYSDSACTTSTTSLSKTLTECPGWTQWGLAPSRTDTTGDNNGSSLYFTADGKTTSAGTNWTVNAPATLYNVRARSCAAGTGCSCSLSVSSSGVVNYDTSANTGYTLSSGNNTYAPACTANEYTCAEGKYLNGVTCSTCEGSYFCKGGTWTYNGGVQGREDCPDTYTSGPGAVSEYSCYKSCSRPCTQQTVPTGAYNVTHGTTSTTGTQYYGGTCSAATSTCSLTVNQCKNGYYLSGGSCGACPSDFPLTDPQTAEYSNETSINGCWRQCNNTVDLPHAATYSGWKEYGGNNTCVISSCVDGYNLTTGQICAQMCDAGIQYLKTGTNISIPLYKSAQTAHSIVIKTGSGTMCYGSLESGKSSGTINVNLGGTTYHTIH